MGIVVQPLARSDSVSENMNNVVPSSRSCGYLNITAITIEFNTMFVMMIVLVMAGFKISLSSRSMLEYSNVCVVVR